MQAQVVQNSESGKGQQVTEIQILHQLLSILYDFVQCQKGRKKTLKCLLS